MNPIETYKEKTMKEFDGLFMNNGVGGMLPDKFQNERDLLIRNFLSSSIDGLQDAFIEQILALIAKEIAESHTSGEPTSRLTRLYNLIADII